MIIIIILDFIQIIINTLSKGDEEYQSSWKAIIFMKMSSAVAEYIAISCYTEWQWQWDGDRASKKSSNHPLPATIFTFLCFFYNKMSFFGEF